MWTCSPAHLFPVRRIKGILWSQSNPHHHRPRIMLHLLRGSEGLYCLTTFIVECPILKPCCLLARAPASSMHLSSLDFNIVWSFPAIFSVPSALMSMAWLGHPYPWLSAQMVVPSTCYDRLPYSDSNCTCWRVGVNRLPCSGWNPQLLTFLTH